MSPASIAQTVRQRAALKAWETRRGQGTRPASVKPVNSDRTQAALKAWVTRRAQSESSLRAQELEYLTHMQAAYRMTIEDSGITPAIRKLVRYRHLRSQNLDALADRIYENAPRATALSRCDGTAAEVWDVIDTDTDNRRELQQITVRIRTLRQQCM